MRTIITFFIALCVSPLWATAPEPWQMLYPQPASPLAEDVQTFHNLLMWIMLAISLLVLGLIIYICIRYSAKNNPKAATFSHNTKLEVIWIVIPTLLLAALAIPSIKIIYAQDKVAEPDLTLKVVGRQWYWQYSYPDNGNFTFSSYMLEKEELKEGDIYLLDVDHEVVLPVNKKVQVLLAGADVIHSWYIPSLAVQTYTIPGRLNETWLEISEPGVYYGQCNQICGVKHAFMPIKIRAVEEAEFNAWVAQAKNTYEIIEN